MSDANVNVIGNVASDVQSHPTKNGDWVASFRLASQRRYFDRRARRWTEEPPSFYRVVCWRGLAENVKNCVKKGEPIVVQGRMKLKDWTDDSGNRRTDAEIDAWSVSYDLMRGTAVFTRTRRSADTENVDDTLNQIRIEQRARAGDEVIVDPDTGEMFNVTQLHRDRVHHDSESDDRDLGPKGGVYGGDVLSETEGRPADGGAGTGSSEDTPMAARAKTKLVA